MALEGIENEHVTPLSSIERDGFAISAGVLDEDFRRKLVRDIEECLVESPAGVRGLAAKVPSIAVLARPAIVRSLVESVLGAEAKLVRSVLFNKSSGANWQVAWHQDLTIAVTNQEEIEGYSSWSVKEGVVHVQPPVRLLEHMLTVRLHLDPADDTNGALWVSPGSHRLGRLRASETARVADRNGKHLCAVQAGDALLLRPLILHASRKATAEKPRRVIHLEFAAAALPTPLAWAEAAA
jgi:ectoine hydroxylase-related dioxygenase (phytanoyl-CoA dioxygenase family)